MMVAYQQKELISSTELVKRFSSVMTKIREKSIAKMGILKNNRLEAVVISTEEYERLKNLEAMYVMQESLPDDLSYLTDKVQAAMESGISTKSHKDIFEELTKRYAT